MSSLYLETGSEKRDHSCHSGFGECLLHRDSSWSYGSMWDWRGKQFWVWSAIEWELALGLHSVFWGQRRKLSREVSSLGEIGRGQDCMSTTKRNLRMLNIEKMIWKVSVNKKFIGFCVWNFFFFFKLFYFGCARSSLLFMLLVVGSRGYSSLQCLGSSLQYLFLFWSIPCR